MTFTEAAVEILRRSGKPLHFKDIAAEAVQAGLLSHVGQTPEATMGARLLAMARREHDRKVVATDTGIFALVEWGLPSQASAVTPADLEPPHEDGEKAYRTRERHPSLQPELTVGGRRDERRRSREEEEEGKRRKRFPPPAEVAHAWLREKGDAVPLAELAAALRGQEKIAEALERDLHSFERALREENRRRRDSGRSELFAFEDEGRVRGLELPKEQPAPQRKEQQPKPEKKREEPRREEAPKLAALDEQRRSVLRSMRRRVGALDAAALERVVVALLEAQGYRELNLARRSAKEGPLYLVRHKWGAGELRYAVRILKPGRDLGRAEVADVRRELAHFSSQVGIVIGSGECSREAKSEANLPNTSPVMLYGNEALAEALIEAGLGITKRLIEWVDYDDEFFAQMGAGEPLPQPEFPDEPAAAPLPAPAPAAALPAAAEGAPREERGRRGRERDRRRERRERREGEAQQQGAQPARAENSPMETALVDAASAEPSPEVFSDGTSAGAPAGAPDTTGAASESVAPVAAAPVESAPPEPPPSVVSEPPLPPPPAAESAPAPTTEAPAESEGPRPEGADESAAG